MDIEYARQLLAIYIENARRVLRAHFGVDRAERSFFNLIELLREETKLGPIFVQAVRDSFIEHDPRRRCATRTGRNCHPRASLAGVWRDRAGTYQVDISWRRALGGFGPLYLRLSCL
jgi:hypothetical protein